MKDIKVFHDEGSIDIDVIENYERVIGYKFPKKYKLLISKHNALYPECDVFNFIEPDGKKNASHIVFFGYNTEKNIMIFNF